MRWLLAFVLTASVASLVVSGCDDGDEGDADSDIDGGADGEGDGDLAGDGDGDADGDGATDADSTDEPDGQVPSCEALSDGCASEFGTLFTRSNGRADGTLVALVEPTDSSCPLFNDDHVVLQLLMLGQVQRLVVAVDGVAVQRVTAPLVGPAFSEGWHLDVDLDYVTDLGLHSADFTPLGMDEAVAFMCPDLELGAPLSVFAYSDGRYPSSAHQVHRNDPYPDGAIVANPTSESPTYLLFRYVDQVF